MSAVAQLLNPGNARFAVNQDGPNVAHITIEPLERGYGDTLGNALRRVLLSSMSGCAVVEAYIDNVVHEYTAIEGVKEDVTDILLNLKNVAIALHGSKDEATFSVYKKGPGVLTAGDIKAGHDGEIINPECVIAHLVSKDTEINMSLRVQRGRGYQPASEATQPDAADQPEGESTLIGGLKIEPVTFTPIRKVAYNVQSTRVAKRTDLDKLTLHVETNGSITPEQALRDAAGILMDQLVVFAGPGRTVEAAMESGKAAAEPEASAPEELLNARLDDKKLNISMRSINRLNDAKIYRVSELVRMTEIDLLKSPGVGMKIINEIKAALAEHGLTLDMQLDGTKK